MKRASMLDALRYWWRRKRRSSGSHSRAITPGSPSPSTPGGGIPIAYATAAERSGPAGQVGQVGWAHGDRFLSVRLIGLAVVFTALFGVLLRRAYVLQIDESERMTEISDAQSSSDVALPALRGRIVDRNGAELAASVEVDSVQATPRRLQTLTNGTGGPSGPGGALLDRVAASLARVLALDVKEVARKLRLPLYTTWIKRRISPDEARALRELALPGVLLTREPRRFYPNRNLAGQVVGWAGVDGKGLEGIELFHDRALRGTTNQISGLRDALGRELFTDGAGDGGHPGSDVVTTIDKFIQYRLERALEDGVLRNHAKAATAVALDPQTGEVLAMASVPSLNPNDPNAGGSDKGARNRAVTDPFEPGSTMKTFSIAAAIEAGLVQLDDKWFCENGRYQIGKATIHDAEPNGTLSTVEVLAKSSNICTAKIAHKSGRERVDNLLRRFGFGTPTGIDLPGERGGLLRPVNRWGEIELATISFGQGVTATPLQLAAGYAAIANGGTLYKPHATRRIVDAKGHALVENRPEGHRIIDAETARTMRGMLHAVTEKGGTAEKLAIPGYPAAGKTGTAQKVDPQTRRYSTEKWASSFVGFAPLDDPRVVLFVVVDEPTGSHFGSAVAGPIWREVMVDALRYLNVPAVPNPIAKEAGSIDVDVVAHAVAQPPKTPHFSEPAPAPANVMLASHTDDAPESKQAGEDGYVAEEEGGLREIPDFTGMSLGAALLVAKRIDLPLDVSGTGLCVSQTPPPGHAQAGVRGRIVLQPPG